MGHPGIAELLNLRDGEAVAPETAGHVEGCAVCRAELAQLHALREGLRVLPPLPPRPEAWPRIVAALEPPVTVAARRSRLRLAVAGIAATVALAVGVGLMVLRPDPVVPQPAAVAATSGVRSQPTLAQLKLQSQRLEAVLAALQAQPRVTSARSAGAIAELEDGIALVDYQLGQADAAKLDDAARQALWRKRVELMQSLVTVRYAGERADSI